jgi:hypothetical protein
VATIGANHDAVRRCHENGRDLPLPNVGGNFTDLEIRPKRHGIGRHRVLHEGRRVPVERLEVHQSEDDALGIDDDADVPTVGSLLVVASMARPLASDVSLVTAAATTT